MQGATRFQIPSRMVARRTLGALRNVASRFSGDTRAAARSAGLLTMVVALNALGNLVFHVFVARKGGVDNYGAVGALLAFGTVGSTLAAGVQYSVARLAAFSSVRSSALLRLSCWAAVPWLLLAALLMVASAPIASYLHLPGPLPVVLAIGYFAAPIAYAVPAGIIVGKGRMVLFAGLTTLSVVFRISFGLLFGGISVNPTAVVGASLLALVGVGVVACWVLLRKPAPSASADVATDHKTRGALAGDSMTASILSAALWGTWTVALLSARHFLPTADAGNFASVQLMATVILFVTAGLATAFYPHIARGRRLSLVALSMGGTLGIALGCALGAAVLGPVLVDHAYGGAFRSSGVLFLALGISAAAIATATSGLWAVHALRRHVGAAAAAIATSFIAEILAASIWHGSAIELAIEPAISMVPAVAVFLGAVAWTSWRGSRSVGETVSRARLRPPMAVSTPLLASTAVGVMVHNEHEMIGRCLESILSQGGPADRVARVVVVISGSTDGTEEEVQAIAAADDRVQVLVESGRNGKAAAINWFLRETQEPICALVSGDTLLQPGALARLLAPLADPTAGMTGARVVPANTRHTPVGAAIHVLWDLHHEVALRHPKLGEAIAFRRVFDRIDTRSLTDEVSIEAIVVEAGLGLHYASEAVVHNHGASNLRDYMEHRRRIHRGHLGVRKSSGYAASTMDPRLVGAATLRMVSRQPWRIPPVLFAAGLEMVARKQAQIDHHIAGNDSIGTWTTIGSAKRRFRVEYQPHRPPRRS
jgi:biofilm PGA synthesis N-glycosyltransferase PgaC